MNEIKSKIYQFIKDKLGVEESMISDTASFRDDLEVDSLDYCEVIVDIEKDFKIQIPDDIYERLNTVGALTNYVSKQIDSMSLGVSVTDHSDHLTERVMGQ